MKNKKKGITYIILIALVAVIVYVAQTMRQWDEGSIDFTYGRVIVDLTDGLHIYRDSKGILCSNPKIEDEIANNEDFYTSLHNIYELDEIKRIYISDDTVMFYYSKSPMHYHDCGFIYGENIKWSIGRLQIEERWGIQMLPNI